MTFDVFWGVLLIGVAAYGVRRYRNRPVLSSKSWRRARLLSLASVIVTAILLVLFVSREFLALGLAFSVLSVFMGYVEIAEALDAAEKDT